MTTRRPSRRPTTPFARRGVLLAAPTLLLAGCGMIPGLPTGGAGRGEDQEGSDGAGDVEATNEPAAPTDSAVADLSVVEVEDEAAAQKLLTELADSQTLLAPFVKATMTHSALLDSLTAEDYTALTGQEPPVPEGSEGGEPATTVLPGEGKQFLLAAWESTDSEWEPAMERPATRLTITHEENDEIDAGSASSGEAGLDGIVLGIVDASPAPEAVTLRAEIEDGVQELSLVDGTITRTIAPAMYERDLEVEVSDADVLDIEVVDGFGAETMPVRGTVESAYLTPFIASRDHGGYLHWAAEDEIHLVVPLSWEMEYSARVEDVSEAVLELSDGTEVRPVQDTVMIFGDKHSPHIATFTIPADETSATLTISPRYIHADDEDFEHTEDPISATLTFS